MSLNLATRKVLIMFAGMGVVGPLITISSAGGAPNSVIPAAPPIAAPCTNSDILSLSADKLEHLDADKLRRTITDRIRACHLLIKNALGNLSPAPVIIMNNKANVATPQPQTTDPCVTVPQSKPLEKLLEAYEALGACVQWVAAEGFTSPSPGTTPTVPPILFGSYPTPFPVPAHSLSAGIRMGASAPTAAPSPWNKAVYVIALAADAPTSAQLVFQTTEWLNDYLKGSENNKVTGPQPDPFSQFSVTYQLVPEPTWTLAQFQSQCFNDPSTGGAIVALQPSTQSASWNYVLAGSYTIVEWSTMVLDCEPTSTTYLNNAALIRWASARPKSRSGTRYSISLGTALGVVAALLAGHPSHMTTYNYATPSPAPAPGATYRATDSVTTYPNNTVEAAAIGLAALNPLASTNLGTLPGTDRQTAQAIAGNLPAIIADLVSDCVPSTAPLFEIYPQCRWFDRMPHHRPSGASVPGMR